MICDPRRYYEVNYIKDEETDRYRAHERRNAYRLRWKNVSQMNLIFCLSIPILTQKNLAHSLYVEYFSRPILIPCFTLCQGNPGGSSSFEAKNVPR